MKSWGVSIASEQKLRKVAQDQLEPISITAESVLFSFSLKRGGEEMRPAPLSYTMDVCSLVLQKLDENHR